METTEKQKFDEWEDMRECVDCNKCVHYWDNSCDGSKIASEGSTRLCKTFEAIRRVDIPQQIEALQKRVESLERGRMWTLILIILVDLGMIFHSISHMLGG